MPPSLSFFFFLRIDPSSRNIVLASAIVELGDPNIMTSKYLYPSLDPDAWVNSSVQTIDYMLSDFFLTDFSQTSVFRGQISSFSYIVESNKGDVDRIASALQSALSTYFSKQFSNVETDVYAEKNPDSNNLHRLNVILTCVDTEGVTYNLSRVVTYSGLKVLDIIKVINVG